MRPGEQALGDGARKNASKRAPMRGSDDDQTGATTLGQLVQLTRRADTRDRHRLDLDHTAQRFPGLGGQLCFLLAKHALVDRVRRFGRRECQKRERQHVRVEELGEQASEGERVVRLVAAVESADDRPGPAHASTYSRRIPAHPG